MFKYWTVWSFIEGVARTGSITTLAYVGLSSASLWQLVLATLIIGSVQMCISAFVAKMSNTRLWLGKEFLSWCIVFGFFATAGTILPLIALGPLGGDLSTYVFIAVGLAIVPGAIADWVFFGTRLRSKDFLGLMIACTAAYLVIGLPSLQELAKLPAWTVIALFGMCAVVGNRLITRRLALLGERTWQKAFVQNMYVGLTTLALCAFALVFVDGTSGSIDARFVLGASVVGVFVILLVGSNLLAFESGASIAAKEAFTLCVFFFGTAAAGAIFLHQQISWFEVAGFMLYGFAYMFLRREVAR